MNLAQIELHVPQVVREAGSLIMSYLNAEKGIENKQKFDLVTIADKKSEEFLTQEFQRLFPETGILAEEGNAIASKNGYTFVIDPLDGTTSFAHTYPFFAVSVGLVNQQNRVVAGYVFNPYYNEFFHAAWGKGAYLNNVKIQVSSQASLENALFATGFPYDRNTRIDQILKILKRVLLTGHDIRRSGSASLDICGVACGRTDTYYEFGLKPWDVCAASLILQEAGGKISLMNGQDFSLDGLNFAASNQVLHIDLVQLLN